MATRYSFAKAKAFLKNLSTTLVMITGVTAVLITLDGNVTNLILKFADNWHALKTSPNAQEMGTDLAVGIDTGFAYIMSHWWEISLGICVVLIANFARTELVVKPRSRGRIGFDHACKKNKPDA